MADSIMLEGTISVDGTLELDRNPELPPGRVRVSVESIGNGFDPQRFWAMINSIHSELDAARHVPRTVEEVEAEREAFRNEFEERAVALEQLQLDGERARIASQSVPDSSS